LEGTACILAIQLEIVLYRLPPWARNLMRRNLDRRATQERFCPRQDSG
jgi:hypothetical protein